MSLVDDGVLSLGDGRIVDREPFGADAEFPPAVTDAVEELGRLEQRLGRYAAPVEAGSAQLGLLDQRDLHPELGRSDGRRVAAEASAEDDQVEGFRGQADARAGGSRLISIVLIPQFTPW